jgi:hypothetical protein
MTITAESTHFSDALISTAPSPQIPKTAASVYDWLIGDWRVDVTDYETDGTARVSKGEWHFSWVLEGRAVQDVWIAPTRAERTAQIPMTNNRYGTTLRTYDPKLDAWRVFWLNPVTQSRTELIGRKVGNEIVHQAVDEDGSFMRWVFTDIKPD